MGRAGARAEGGSVTTRIDGPVWTMGRAGARAEGGSATRRIDGAVRKMGYALARVARSLRGLRIRDDADRRSREEDGVRWRA
jgi:hypothetical protein